MSNKCVIIAKSNFLKGGIGIELLWNGGRDTVEALLEYCRIKRYPSISTGIGIATFCQVASNFIGDGCYVKIDMLANLSYDNSDNGTYIIEDYDIVDRQWFTGKEQCGVYPIEKTLIVIDEAQPIAMQIEKYLKAIPIETNAIMVGDKIVGLTAFNEVFEKTVVGIGGEHDYYPGKPYVASYSKDDPASNPNNYLTRCDYRKVVASDE